MAAKSSVKKTISEPKSGAKATIDHIDLSNSDDSSEDFEDYEEFSGFASTDDESEAVNLQQPDAELEKIKLLASESKQSSKKPSEVTGTVYVGRIPHGLYEDQLRSYLSQFGTITRMRLSRNKETGRSKHYGFVEFASRDVAQIVCETMDNYLLFGHLLKVKMMDPSQIHASLWTGANRKFHSVPWDLVKRQQLERKHPREYWQSKQSEVDQQRQAKARRLADLGIKY